MVNIVRLAAHSLSKLLTLPSGRGFNFEVRRTLVARLTADLPPNPYFPQISEHSPPLLPP